MLPEFDFSTLLESLRQSGAPLDLIELAMTQPGKSAAFSGFLHAQRSNPLPIEEYIAHLNQESLLQPHESLGQNLALDSLQIAAYRNALAKVK